MLAVIRTIHDSIVIDRATGIVRTPDPRGCEIVRGACAEQGMTVDEWLASLHADVELLRLFEQALDELVVDPPDPGPYDAISRESPSGSPDDERDAFERDARLLGRARR